MSSDAPVPFVQSKLARYGRIPDSLLKHPDATDRAVRLFGILDRHDGGRGIYPSRTRLAKLCGCSVKSIDRATLTLMSLGYVEVTTRRDDTNRQKSNFYVLHFEPKTKGGSVTRDTGEGDTRVAPQGDTRVAHNESKIERSPTGSKPAKPASSKPPKKKTPAQEWQEAQFAKVKQIAPNEPVKEVYKLLGFLKKTYSPQAVIERALDRLVAQELNLGGTSLWQYVRAECDRQQAAKTPTKRSGPAEVSAPNSRRGA